MDRLPLFDKAPAPTRKVLSVSQLTAQIKLTLEEALPQIWVSGEVSDVARPQSGHLYFTLKDEHAQIRAVIWRSTAQRLGFDLRDGQQIVCQANLDVYPPRGGYQLVVRQAEPLGLGAQQLALRQLHARLAKEGLFDPARKRALPRFPRTVAVVTSPTGAAIRDFLEVQRRRWKGTRVLVVPARMQGDQAAREVVQGLLRAAALRPLPDCLVVARGGGSIDDLSSFNQEAVVRAIVAAPVPVVSAIGHEIDVTLADLAADVRALTPTEAAERVLPSQEEVGRVLMDFQHRMSQRLVWRLQEARLRLDRLAERPVLARPYDLVRQRQREVDELGLRLGQVVGVCTRTLRQKLDAAAGKLESLSPLAVLSRGYSVTRAADGRLVRDAVEVQPGERLTTRLARGTVYSYVERSEVERPGSSPAASAAFPDDPSPDNPSPDNPSPGSSTSEAAERRE